MVATYRSSNNIGQFSFKSVLQGAEHGDLHPLTGNHKFEHLMVTMCLPQGLQESISVKVTKAMFLVMQIWCMTNPLSGVLSVAVYKRHAALK